MRRYVHYHNISTGVAFWSGSVEFDDGEVTEDGLNQLLGHSNARLTSWDESQQAGVFAIGPLPGLVIVTETAEPRDIDAFDAAQLFESVQMYPVDA